MKQVVLNIPDSKYPFFMELVKKLRFIKVTEETKLPKKTTGVCGWHKKSLEQVEQHYNTKPLTR